MKLFQDRRKMMIITTSIFFSLALIGTVLLLVGLFATWHFTKSSQGALNWNNQYSAQGGATNIFSALHYLLNTTLNNPNTGLSVPSPAGVSLLKTAVAGAAIWFANIPVFLAACYYIVSYLLIRF